MRFKFLSFLFLIHTYAFSQVVAEGDAVLCEGDEGTPVVLTATSFAVDLTDANIYTDDIFGGVINMGFDFEFYGNTYNQVVLSSNNYLSFNTANAGGYSGWNIGAAVPNNFDAPMNAILCPWQDIYPGVNGNGTIQYATIGEAPNRVFIASFCGIPMFSCTDICYSSQIKLFESTNIIETHIAQKVLCTTWNGGAAIHGLHNQDGSIAHVVTGLDGIERNFPNQWTCENDGWRFTPNGDNDYTIENIEFAPAVAGTDITWQDEFGNKLKFILDGGSSKVGLESTIISLVKKPEILRLGGLEVKKIDKILKTNFKFIKKNKKIIVPGQSNFHYSPGIPIRLNVKKPFSDEAFILIQKRKYFDKNHFYLSKSKNLNEAGKKLYTTLRKIKKLKYKKIAIEKIPNTGLGQTINDRLKRASKI